MHSRLLAAGAASAVADKLGIVVAETGIPRVTAPGVLLIDAQPAFVDAAGDADAFLPRLAGLLAIAGCLQLPIIATFERPEKNGWLPEPLESLWPSHGIRLVKRTFDCCGEPEISAAIEGQHVRQFLIAGSETDVCVLQSVLSLRKRGYVTFLLEDCLFSSERHTRAALNRMYAAGAVPCTLKTAYYELMGTAAVLDDPAAAGPGWAALRELLAEPEALPDWRPSD